jgi:hypothetical protein
MHEVYKVEYRGCVIKAYYDQDASHTNPIDKMKYDDTFIWAVWERNSIFSDRDYRPVDDPSEMPDWAEENGYELFPLFKYEHSGVAYSIAPFSCRWDSGQVGYLAIKKSAFTSPEAKPLQEYAEQFVKTAGAWCNGEVYGYTAYTEDGEDIDSCWGFIGDDGYSWRNEDCYMIQQAKENIDYYLKEQAEIPYKYQEDADAAMNG